MARIAGDVLHSTRRTLILTWSVTAMVGCGGNETQSPDQAGGMMHSFAGTSAQAGGMMQGAGGGSAGAAMGEPATQSRTCRPPSAEPALRVTGTVCGEVVEYSSPDPGSLTLGQRSFLAPIDQITSIRAGDLTDGEGGSDDGYFDTHDALLSLDLDTGPLYEAGTGTYTMVDGALFLCGVGAIALTPSSPVALTIHEVDDATIRATLADVPVLGMSEDLDAAEVTACDGLVTIDVAGPWSRYGL